MDIEKILNNSIKTTLKENGIYKNKKSDNHKEPKVVSESYVTQAAKFDLNTELLTTRNKKNTPRVNGRLC